MYKDPTVRSASRVLDVLELLVKHPEGLVLTEISQRLNIPVSSLHNLLATLVRRKYLLRDDNSSRFRVGSKLIQLASQSIEPNDIIPIVDNYMEELKNLVGETTSLAILEGSEIVFIHKKAAPGVLQVINPVGTHLPAHATGSGKVILAHMKKDDVEHLYPGEDLPKLTQNTIDTKQGLIKELIKIKQDGYAFDQQESALGVWAIASCILDHQGKPIAALSIVGPSFRIDEKDTTTWRSMIKTTAEKISAHLGFTKKRGEY